MARRHLALYGNVAIPRRYCHRCQCYTLIIDGMRQCCGYSTKEDERSAKIKRMCQGSWRRKRPTQKQATALLSQQENCCFYCEQRFGSYYHVGTKVFRLDIQYDHIEPHVYGWNNKLGNFVAACRRCNAWKGSQMFKTIDEIRTYLVTRWEKKIWQKYGRNPEADARIAARTLNRNDDTTTTVVPPVVGKVGIALILGLSWLLLFNPHHVSAEQDARQSGLATWYSRASAIAEQPQYHGLTASGEPLDEAAITCAHPTAAFGTRLKVSTPTRSLVCRVNDRGPGRTARARGVVIDLTPAAYDALGGQRGVTKRGVAWGELAVRIERLP